MKTQVNLVNIRLTAQFRLSTAGIRYSWNDDQLAVWTGSGWGGWTIDDQLIGKVNKFIHFKNNR
jgi:hypothetical protein